MSSRTICVSLALVKHRMWWRGWALKIQGSTLSGSLFRRGRLWMMALVWDAAFFFFFHLCAAFSPWFPISGWASQIQGGKLPPPGAPSAWEQECPGSDGAVLAWSSVQFLVQVCGTEIKGCWSGLSLLILLYSDRLLCLSCKTNRQSKSLRKKNPDLLISPSPAGISSSNPSQCIW